ncbi:peptidylprolyl isomerase [Carboxylicivirga sediminis]|uniref:Peptidylprolyl isomerase n=1 Tax=Carboxylicivirga sediminis TaxID=2006564 RepID=A0A941IYY7_9BACT|nr:peptidylprolyl isomerase [Carboxylicivirga sediminis]MBR8536277.1 peptidylprolyl isomerase [Carboxylicivirga sediminis]
MNRLVNIILLSALFTQAAFAQDNTLLTIGDKQFSVDEFNYIYEKNNTLSQEPISKKEYIDLFVNYKLKVEEAIAQGYDTVPSFQKELQYYRDELAKPYLSDKKAIEGVVEEAYERMCYEVDASHILIKLPPSPTPEDTLKAYNKIMDVKQQLGKGADFEEMVLRYSEGPSAKQSNGHLGYFTAFMMVYPFEEAAFNTPVGGVSEIVRTAFGYHLIKVHDKRKNKGEIQVAHIMKAFPYKASEAIQTQAKIAIDSIYRKLQNGESFNALVAEYSDDKQTVPNNGKLPWFTTGRMVPEFSEAAFALTENGQIAPPVKTQFGWHIIKRLDSRPVKPLEECRDDIMQKIKQDERSLAGQKATVARLKNEYQFTIDAKGYKQLKAFVINKSKTEGWVDALEANDWLVASYAGGQISSADFAKEMAAHRMSEQGVSGELFTNLWNSYTDKVMIAVEKNNLEKKYPEFKYLMGEYHDGLLIFEISQSEVWNKASNDSVGLAAFYEAHKDSYVQEEHFDGRIIYCKTKAGYKQLKKLAKKGEVQIDSLAPSLREELLVKQGPFYKGDEAQLDKQMWKVKTSVINTDYPYLLSDGHLVSKRIQPMEEIRGRVISDYQEQLEQQWIESLQQKYNPKVNTFVFD